jgi:hypothetical protein
MKTSEQIIKYIEEHKEVSASELTSVFTISERAIFKQLAALYASGKLSKVGSPPKVFYKIHIASEKLEDVNNIPQKFQKIINDNFLNITPLGEYLEGINGFSKWCRERKLNIDTQAEKYVNLIRKINFGKKNGVIIATNKFKKAFKRNYLTNVFFIDFYSIPQFGKTKLGQLLLYAKQSQDRARIIKISTIVKPSILKIIKRYKIDAVGFIPPTIKREVQFMKELEKGLNLAISILKVSKIKTDVIVPQKTLAKLEDRITNAKNTIIVEDKRPFMRVLLIDDAVGSGASLNETAKKLTENKLAEKVYGCAITGCYKGYDVISEV